MKSSKLFITVLFSLFLFQSIWNVAAAYCVHDVAKELAINHLGHHSHYKENTSQSFALMQYFDQIGEDDHDDHLPSIKYMYFCLVLMKFECEKAQVHLKAIFFDRENFYQSPDLTSLKPPPPYPYI